MPVNSTPTAIVRVIDVSPTPDGRHYLVILDGDQQREIPCPAPPPTAGDILELTGNPGAPAIRKLGGVAAGAWNPGGDVLRWRRPGPGGRTRMSLLRQRHLIRHAVRDYFDREGFIEIDAPLLVRGTTPDASIPSFEVADRYLVTSTEYQIKRMIAGGFDRLYTLTQNFRAGDTGAQNNPEFTMLEWARAGVTLEVIERDVERFVAVAHAALGGGDTLYFQDHRIDLRSPWARMTVADALSHIAHVHITDFSLPALQKATQAAGIPVRTSQLEDQVFLFTVLLDHAQHGLGFERPVFLRDWPSFLTSSALERPGGVMADRSELFIAGVELGDGFPSLTDYDRQRHTFAQQLARRQTEGAPAVSLDDRYLDALRNGLPPGAGMALGFDRLVMLLTGQTRIGPVLAFDWDEV
jgi:lysyl-tRNA synthetase class 2